MPIPAKDGTGADITLASVATAAGELPTSTPGDPATGLPFKASSEATLELIRALLAGTVTVQESTTGTHFQPGFDMSSGVGAGGPLRTDPDGNLVARAQVLTDELGYRANFANTSLAVSLGTATFTNGSREVTGSGFVSASDLRTGDYVKLNADAESAWVQVESLDGDGALTLGGNYTGAGGTGAASRAIVKPVTGAGATISVASGQCTIAAGTTAGSVSEVERDVDWLPLVKQSGVSVSQRITNQGVYVGFYDELHPTTPYWFAWFLLDGTVNTTVKCQSARNPSGPPSAAETEETTVSLPNGATTATVRRFRPEVLGDRVNFLIDGMLVATHYRAMPGPGDLLTSAVRVVNGGVAPASNTNIVIDYDTVKNHNKLEVGLLSDAERVVAAQPDAEIRSYTAGAVVIPINTDLMIIDCSQFRSLSIISGAVGTTGVVTGAWSNDGATDWITATLLSETGASSTTFTGASALLRTTPVRARYFRLRMTTATTAAGATRINVACFQTDLSAAIATQPVSLATNTPVLAASTNRAGFVAGAGIWYDDSSTALAANATFTGTSRDATVTATAAAFANAATYAKEIRLSGESDQSGSLWLEVSRDNANWRRVKSVATAAVAGGGQYAEIVHRPSWRYWRSGFTNGATLQTRFTIGSVATAV